MMNSICDKSLESYKEKTINFNQSTNDNSNKSVSASEVNVINTRNTTNTSNLQTEWNKFCDADDDKTILQMLNDDEPFELILNNSRLRTDEKYYGFDNNVGETWIYPTNLPIRNYQFNITRSALFKNTLVILPTGLGKTFIAAVIMYNIYRWYPMGKIIFMAPTRPLVNQQINACHNIFGIPLTDVCEMTGKQNKKIRRNLWLTKRIFFATPQVIQSDINDNEQKFPFNDIKLLVIDEAHKAKGRYAYTEVVKSITLRNRYYRILALSATPGRRIEDVIEILQNLLISHIELRWENSVDVMPYTYKRNIKIVVVPIDEKLKQIRNDFIEIIDPYIRNLINNGILNEVSINNLNRGWLIMEQKRFKELSIRQKHPNHAGILTDFSICISLYHALELLEKHGIKVFLNFFDNNNNDTNDTNSTINNNNGKNEKFFVSMNLKLKKFLDDLRQQTGPNPFNVSDQTMTNGKIANIPDNLDFGHPKYEMTKKLLLEHFEKESNSRAIIFCEYRESVLLIHRLLLQCRPLIKPRIFVGQGGGAGCIRAVTQKQQIQIMSDFRNGISNTLISTCVAEEGIDVGDVNLIICFDINTKNPIRLIQRIGRTGRKRNGHVFMLATEGKEHTMIKDVIAIKDKTTQKIIKNREIQNIIENNRKYSPRIVPSEFDPKCIQTYIRIPKEQQEQEEKSNNGKIKNTKKQKNKKTIKKTSVETVTDDDNVTKNEKSNCIRKFFKKIDLDDNEQEIFENSSKNKLLKNVNSLILEENFNLIHSNNSNTDDDDKLNESILKNDTIKMNKYSNIIRKLNNFSRRLDNNPIDDDSQLIEKPIDAIKSKILSKNGKRFYLENNYDYIKDKYEAIKAVESINLSSNEITEDIINLKNEFSLIENIFNNNRNEIINYLEQEELNDKNNLNLLMNKKFENLFNGLEKRNLFDNVEIFINDKLKEIEINRSEEEESKQIELNENDKINMRNNDNNNESIVYNNSINENYSQELNDKESFLTNDFTDNEFNSKYINQSENFQYDEIKIQSTPLKITNRSNNNNVSNIKEINNEFDKNDDFFDDDFNEILMESSDIFNFENQINNDTSTLAKKDDQQKDEKRTMELITTNSDFRNSSITNKKDNDKKNVISNGYDLNRSHEKMNLDLDIENFNLNEFLEPFDDITPTEEEKDKDKIIIETENVVCRSPENIENKKPSPEPKEFIKGQTIIKTNDTSPSIFKRKINYSKLKLFNSEGTILNNDKTVQNLHSTEIQNYEQFDESKSIIRRVTTLKRNKRVIEESSDDTDTEIEDNEILASQKNQKSIEVRIKNRKRIKRRRCSFIDDEAKCSENDDSNDNFDSTVINSIIDNEYEEPSFTLTAHAKYLQSRRSPLNNFGGYKIPLNRNYLSLSEICSQPINNHCEDDNEKMMNTYKEDSFVISDDENIPENEINDETCPLERAEKILKIQRKLKRKKLLNRKMKIITKFTESSDENDG